MSQRYPREVHAFIRDHVAGRTAQELADMTNAAFGTNFTASSMKSYKANHKLNSGLTGRFEKGHIPPNKGRKGYVAPGSEKGWFQKGSTPWDTVPVGTIVTKTDGYLWKKIDDKPGVWLQNWKQLHLLIWEDAYGPVPEGHRVIFKDGDHQNCTLENLALVTLAENAVMNKSGLRFTNAAHTETGILIAKIKIAAGKRKKRRNTHERKSNSGGHQGAGEGAGGGAAV